MIAWPLDGHRYTADAIGAWCGTRTRGVFSAENNFAVSAAGGRQIRISPGLAWLRAGPYWGCVAYETEETQLEIETGNAELPRWIAVAIRLDKAAGTMPQIVLHYGLPAAQPAKPVPVRDESTEEIILASILQRASAAEIRPDDIIDERLNEEFCGLMRDGVTGIPTQQLQAQFTGVMDQLEKALAEAKSLPFAPVGAVIPFAGGKAPEGWLLCDGRTVPRQWYPALYGVIGTTYGPADDMHFTLPDLRERFVAGAGTEHPCGMQYGKKEHAFMWENAPAEGGLALYQTQYSTVISETDTHLYGVNNSITGKGVPIPTVPPATAMNYIIKY